MIALLLPRAENLPEALPTNAAGRAGYGIMTSMLTNAVVRSLERASIRTRESNVTRSAWRMEVECDEGSGTLTLLENAIVRGDGLFLGWPQEELAATYQALLKKDDEAPLELLQLG